MPTKFQEFRKTTTVELPVSKAKVEIYDGFLAEQIDKIQNAGGKPSSSMIVKMIIKSWDFVDNNDQPIPVEEKYTKSLHIKDVLFIIKEAKLDDFLEESSVPKNSQA